MDAGKRGSPLIESDIAAAGNAAGKPAIVDAAAVTATTAATADTTDSDPVDTTPTATTPTPTEPTPLLTFPCTLSLKVFTRTADNLQSPLRELIQATLPPGALLDITARSSGQGRYQAFTCRLRAPDRATLDALSTRLSRHPKVVMVL